MIKSRIDTIEIQSRTLGKTMVVTIYMPTNFCEGLPVLYFMHGRSGDESIIHALDIQTVADKMIADGRMKPMLIVCPRMEDALGLGAFEDYFFNEVMPIVEKQYKTSVRCIGGVSAGGFIALNYAFRHPYLFERVGGHMPAIEDVLDDDDLHYFGTSEQWKANNPLFLVQKCTLPSTMEIYLDAGSEDEGGFYRGCAQLAERLAVRGVLVQNHLNEGHHTIDYIKAHLEEYLMFYAK